MKILVERSFVGTPFNRIAAYDVFHAFANLGVDSFHGGIKSWVGTPRRRRGGSTAAVGSRSPRTSRGTSRNLKMTVQKIMNAPSDSTVITE